MLSIGVLGGRTCCRGRQASLFFKMSRDLGCGFWPDKWFEVFDGRLRHAFDRAKVAKQFQLSLLADSRDLGQLGCKVALFATLAVKL